MAPTLIEFRRWLQGEPVEAEGLPVKPKPIPVKPKPSGFDPSSSGKVLLDRPALHEEEGLFMIEIPVADQVRERWKGKALANIRQSLAGKEIKWDDVVRVERVSDPVTSMSAFTIWVRPTSIVRSAAGLDADFAAEDIPAPKGPDLGKLKGKPKRRPCPGTGKYTIATDGDDAILHFGKHDGSSLSQIKADDPTYLRWILGEDFPDELRELVQEVLDRGALAGGIASGLGFDEF